MKRVFFRSILLRYIISYIIVMAVLYTGVSIYVSNIFASTIHTSIVEENTNRLSALRMQHEEKLAVLFSIGNQISLSPYISPFKLKESPIKAFHLKQQLISYTSADDFFDQMYIIFHEDNYLYSSATSVSIEMYTEKLIHYDSIPSHKLRELLRRQDSNVSIIPNQNIQSVLTSGTNKRMVTIIVPLRLEGRFSIGNVMFLIQDGAYQRMFADEIHQMRNMYIFYGQELLSVSRRYSIEDEVVRSAISSQVGTYIRNLTVDGVDYLLFVQNGSLLDMCYVSLIPQETVQMRTARSRMRFGLFMLLLSIPCSLLTIYFARRHVRPIKELQRSIGANNTSGDGFAVIRNRIETIMGQNIALHTRLDESMAASKADFVKNFVKGRYITREEAVNAAISLGLNVDRAFYCVTLIAAAPQDRHELKSLFGLAEDGEDVIGYFMEIVDQEQYLFALFADTGEALESWAYKAKAVLSSMDKEAVMAVSNIHTDFSQASVAYLEASYAYDSRFVMGSEHVLWFSDIGSSVEKAAEPFSQDYLDGFRKALHAGNASALNDRINSIFQILSEKKFSLFSFRVIYNDIISMLLSKYFSYDNISTDKLQYYDIFELSRCRRIGDLVDILRQLCNEILLKEEQNVHQDHSMIRQVIAHMHEHYTDPGLTMGSIADIFGISAARLSLEFKELIDIYPSEYLLLLRIEKAKELLAETEMLIQDIGTSVGYNDASGFIRRFKRHMGVTPAQYRQSLKNNSGDSNLMNE